MDIFGMIKKLGEGVGKAVGQAVQGPGKPAAQAVKAMNKKPALSPPQPGVNFNPGGGYKMPATVPSVDGIRFGQQQAPSFSQFNQMSRPGGGLGQLQVPGAAIQYDPYQPDPGEINFNPGGGYDIPATMPELPIYTRRRR